MAMPPPGTSKLLVEGNRVSHSAYNKQPDARSAEGFWAWAEVWDSRVGSADLVENGRVGADGRAAQMQELVLFLGWQLLEIGK